MDDSKCIQILFMNFYLHKAETYNILATISGILFLGLLPSMLVLADIVLYAGGNVPDVFFMLGILEIGCFLVFGVSAVMGKRCRKKAYEYAAMINDEKSNAED